MQDINIFAAVGGAVSSFLLGGIWYSKLLFERAWLRESGAPEQLNLKEVFAVLKPGLSVDLAPVTPTIYQDLDAKYDNFKSHTLVSIHHFESDWNVWERHPAGDEIVVLLSGSARMTFRKEKGEETQTLTEPGTFVVVPRNTWHTAETSEPTRMLFVTPGEGTENREDP